MGHCIHYSSYPVETNLSAITADMNDRARYDSDTHGGLVSKIRFIDVVCKDEEEARNYIQSHDKGWYDQLAVKYNESEPNTSKKYLNADAKVKALEFELYKLESSPIIIKGELASCPHCKSKVNKKYIYGPWCPVCRGNIRPLTLQNKINKLKTRIEEAKKKRFECGTKKLYWLVKIEYHV